MTKIPRSPTMVAAAVTVCRPGISSTPRCDEKTVKNTLARNLNGLKKMNLPYHIQAFSDGRLEWPISDRIQHEEPRMPFH